MWWSNRLLLATRKYVLENRNYTYKLVRHFINDLKRKSNLVEQSVGWLPFTNLANKIINTQDSGFWDGVTFTTANLKPFNSPIRKNVVILFVIFRNVKKILYLTHLSFNNVAYSHILISGKLSVHLFSLNDFPFLIHCKSSFTWRNCLLKESVLFSNFL